MERENICKFSASDDGDGSLFAFQFIYETSPMRLGDNRSYAAFVCHLVTDGEAMFRTSAGEWTLRPGDLFFAFPSVPFTLEADDSFQYLYISFVGSRASELLASVGITRTELVRREMGELCDLWRFSLERCHPENLSFMAKGVLYSTFACLKQSPPGERSEGGCEEAVARIRESLEREYADGGLSLEGLAGRYGYNAKYLSRRFRETVGVSFSDYLTSCRIRHACILLDEGTMTIREIAASVGYSDALYFSKVFRRIMKTAPSDYRESKKPGSADSDKQKQ